VANQFLNATTYASSMLLLLKNQLVMGRLVNSKYEDRVTDENGLATNVKRPPRFARNDASALSAALAAQDILTGSIPISVNQYAKVHVSVGDIEWVQSYNELMRNSVMKAAASTLAHQVDSFLMSKTVGFNGYVGHATTLTNNIGSPAEFNPVHTRLMENGVPNSDLNAVLTFADAEEIRGSLIGGNIQGVNRTALERARVPMLSEIDAYATQQIYALTVGTRVASATSLIDNGTHSVNYRDVKALSPVPYQTLHIDGQAMGVTFKVGEKLTIADVNAWDWRNNVALPYLQQFTIIGGASTASGTVAAGSAPGTVITADANGDTDLYISPPLIVSGSSDGVSTAGNTAFATVDAAAVDGAAVTHLGAASTTHRLRSAFHKDAITMVSAKLHAPFSDTSSFATDKETGISIRYWRGSDISTGAHVHRWDMMFGAALTDPFLGCHVSGT
jgi:hypothetical protein